MAQCCRNNTLKEEFVGLRESAHHQVEGNSVATEYIWKVLGNFLKNIGGFIIYLFIISGLDPILMLVVVATCFVSFFVSRSISTWMYTHRDAGVCLEGAIIVLACIIYSKFATSVPSVDATASAITQVWTYVGELLFNMLVLVGTIKLSDQVVQKMIGI